MLRNMNIIFFLIFFFFFFFFFNVTFVSFCDLRLLESTNDTYLNILFFEILFKIL